MFFHSFVLIPSLESIVHEELPAVKRYLHGKLLMSQYHGINDCYLTASMWTIVQYYIQRTVLRTLWILYHPILNHAWYYTVVLYCSGAVSDLYYRSILLLCLNETVYIMLVVLYWLYFTDNAILELLYVLYWSHECPLQRYSTSVPHYTGYIIPYWFFHTDYTIGTKQCWSYISL